MSSGVEGTNVVRALTEITKIHSWNNSCKTFLKIFQRVSNKNIQNLRFDPFHISKDMLTQMDEVLQLMAKDSNVDEGEVRELVDLMAYVSRAKLPSPVALILNNLSFVTNKLDKKFTETDENVEQDLQGFGMQYGPEKGTGGVGPTARLSSMNLHRRNERSTVYHGQWKYGEEERQETKGQQSFGDGRGLTTEMLLGATPAASVVSARTTSPPRKPSVKIDFTDAREKNKAVDDRTKVGANEMDARRNIQKLKKLIGEATKSNEPGAVEEVFQYMVDNCINICRHGYGSTTIWGMNNLASFIDSASKLPVNDGSILYKDDVFAGIANLDSQDSEVTSLTAPVLMTAMHVLGTDIYDHILEVYIDIMVKLMPSQLKMSFNQSFGFHINKEQNAKKNKFVLLHQWNKEHSSITSGLFHGRTGEIIDTVVFKSEKYVLTLLEFWNKIKEARDDEIEAILTLNGVDTFDKAMLNALRATQIIQRRSSDTTLEVLVNTADKIETVQLGMNSVSYADVYNSWNTRQADTSSSGIEASGVHFTLEEDEQIAGILEEVVDKYIEARVKFAGKMDLGGPKARHKASSLIWHFKNKLASNGFRPNQVAKIVGTVEVGGTGSLVGFVQQLESRGDGRALISLLNELPKVIELSELDLPAPPKFSVDENLMELVDQVKVFEKIVDVMYYAFKYFIMNNGRKTLTKFVKKLFAVPRIQIVSVDDYIINAQRDLMNDEVKKLGKHGVFGEVKTTDDTGSKTLILPPSRNQCHLIKDDIFYEMVKNQSEKETAADRNKLLNVSVKKIEINSVHQSKPNINTGLDQQRRRFTGIICKGVRDQISGEKGHKDFFIARDSLQKGNRNLTPSFVVPEVEGFNLGEILRLGMEAYTKKLKPGKKKKVWSKNEMQKMSAEMIIQLVKSVSYGYAMNRKDEKH